MWFDVIFFNALSLDGGCIGNGLLPKPIGSALVQALLAFTSAVYYDFPLS